MQVRLTVILILAAFCQLFAIPHGKVVEGLKMKSEIVGYDVNFSVYLPPDYDYSSRAYPVVYLLHGYSDNETAWVQFGQVHMAADEAIANREIPAMIIVMPDAKITWYANDIAGKDRYEDMFFEELIPYVESIYRIRAKKEYRGVCGLSMGGFGSLLYAMHHPDMFAACAPFSAGVFTDAEMVDMETKTYSHYFQNLFSDSHNSDKRLTAYWKDNNPLELAKTLPVESLKSVRYYVDCGDDDFLIRGNCELHLTLKDREIPHEFRVRDGSHNWTYWRTGIADALKFIGKSFHR